MPERELPLPHRSAPATAEATTSAAEDAVDDVPFAADRDPAAFDGSEPAGSATTVPHGAAALAAAGVVERDTRRAVRRLTTRSMAALSLAGIPIVAWLPGSPATKAEALVALTVLAGVYAFALRPGAPSHDGDRPVEVTRTHAAVGGAAFVALHHAFGLTAGLPFGAFLGLSAVMLGLAGAADGARALVLICGALYAVLFPLAIVGAVRTDGLLASDAPDSVSLAVAFAGAELHLAVVFVLGTILAKALRDARDRMATTVRDAVRREAAFREIQADLDIARGIGRAGVLSELVVGGYRLGLRIGQGGMGDVYDAIDLRTQAPAAVKVMRREAMGSPEALDRFSAEARIVAELDDPSVVRVLDVGGRDAETPFIAMERLHGEDLSQRLRRDGHLDVRDVDELVQAMCRALSAAHRRGVIHCDLKPANLFHAVAPDGSTGWKVLDFGIARIARAGDLDAAEEAAIGTPAYMAPEQLRPNGVLDARTDVHGVCLVAYRALTGLPAFPSAPEAAAREAAMRRLPADPSTVANVPADVAAVLRIGLSKDPDERFDSAASLGQAFAEAVRGELADSVRRRAAALCAHHDWGRVLASAAPDAPTRGRREPARGVGAEAAR